jgi:F0F1-type ATP synthase assembly protein I
MLAVQMEPAARPSFQPAAAGGVLLGVLFASVALGAFIGWALGSAGYGILIGAVVGLPLAVFSVYRRYRGVI